MMGFLTKLFSITPPPEQPPTLNSIYPAAAVAKLNNGTLPDIKQDKLILKNSEICHFVDTSALITEKKHYERKSNGQSIRIMKSLTWHFGDSASIPVSEPHYTKGILFITNQRVVFTANHHAFDENLNSLTAVTPYTDGIVLQFGAKTYTMLLPDGDMVTRALHLII